MLWHRLLSGDAALPALRQLHSHGSDLGRRRTVPHILQAESSALTAATLALAAAALALAASTLAVATTPIALTVAVSTATTAHSL